MSTKNSMTNISLSSSNGKHKAIDAQKHRGYFGRRPACAYVHVYRSISCLKKVKQKQKNLINNYVGLHGLMTVQQNMNIQYDESVEQMMQMKNDVRKIKYYGTKYEQFTNFSEYFIG